MLLAVLFCAGTTDYDDVLDCEFYTSDTDQWTAVAPMLTGQSDVGVAVFQEKIFVTGQLCKVIHMI